LSYSVKYEDIGLRDFKETWDYQAALFKNLVDNKTETEKEGRKKTDTLTGTLIFVEHPHVYTLGKNGSGDNLLINQIQLRAKDASFYRIDRGGDITYHGPGQIVGYPIFDLEMIQIGLKTYIYLLEEAIIRVLEVFGIKGSRLRGGTGVWIDPELKGGARKICAIGVKASRYVTMHGFAFNVNTDLSFFNHINPCGFTDKGVTSLEKETGHKHVLGEIKNITRMKLGEVFDLSWTNIKE
jgi:lipoyl(octanoyl) transferase